MIDHVSTNPSPYRSSYEATNVVLRLNTRSTYSIFFKNLGISRVPKREPGIRQERELSVYRDILSTADLGTPQFLGAEWDEQEGIFWLFLELVPGKPLRELDLSGWTLSAEWLGRMAGTFADRTDWLASHAILAMYDPAGYRAAMRKSVIEVESIAPDLLGRWMCVVGEVDAVLDSMADLPCTLVHGDFCARNILIDPSHPPRVCPVDWERAAVGPLYEDLAYIVDGLDPLARARCLEAYRREAGRAGQDLPGSSEMSFWIDTYRLIRIMTWLSDATARAFTNAKVNGLIEYAEQVLTGRRRSFTFPGTPQPGTLASVVSPVVEYVIDPSCPGPDIPPISSTIRGGGS